MAKHPRLVKRGNVWYARVYVPRDIQKTLGKTEIPRSLRTSDQRQALHKLRTEVDPHFEKFFEDHRREQARLAQPPLESLTDDQIQLIGDAYYRHLLDEDAEYRESGFDTDNDDGRERAFDEYVEDVESDGDSHRHHLARGIQSEMIKDEARDVLSWEDVNLRLSEASPSWPKVVNAILKATVRANDDKRRRNVGDVVETPKAPPALKEPLTIT